MHVSYRSGGTQPACPTPLPHNRPASYIDFRKVNTLYRSVLRWKTVPPAARTPPTAAGRSALRFSPQNAQKFGWDRMTLQKKCEKLTNESSLVIFCHYEKRVFSIILIKSIFFVRFSLESRKWPRAYRYKVLQNKRQNT